MALRIMDLCIPSSTLKPRKNLPWLTKPIIQLMRKRNTLFRAASKTKMEAAVTKYKCVRNRVVAMLRTSKSKYFRNLGHSSQKDFWKAVKLIRRQESSIPALKNGPTLATSNSDKALLLNEFFYSCFNDSFCPLTETTRLDPSKCPPHLLCTEEEVADLLLSLDPAKSTGPDKISAIMLRSTAVLIAPSLTKLFNLSITSGRFPTDWKCARITPIFKSGDSALASNYRPISILPIVSKVLERHIYTLLFDFLATNSPISLHQWGFMPNRSTVSALCTLIHDCLKSLDDGNEICSVYFDLRKAFDTVPHVPLLNKLTNLQLDKHVLTWIQSYLANRSQVVAVGGDQSSSVPVISGVPQGSVLGPLLFLVYINDVTSLMSAPSKLTLFADDMTLYRTISSPADYIVLQSDITAISTWVAGNHLQLNSNKCCFMLISRKRFRSIPPPTLYIDSNTALTQVKSVKYLGIQLTCDLSWSSHITTICSKTRRLVGLLYRQFHLCAPETALRLYKTFIRPHLEYASVVWDPYLAKDIQSLEQTQKFALRMCFRDWSCPYQELLVQAETPSLAERRERAKLCHLYKIVHGLTDCQSAPVQVKSPAYNTRQVTDFTLENIRTNTSQFLYSFFPHSISLWNSQSTNTQTALSFYTFKQLL